VRHKGRVDAALVAVLRQAKLLFILQVGFGFVALIAQIVIFSYKHM
jgi:hypothetical protein